MIRSGDRLTGAVTVRVMVMGGERNVEQILAELMFHSGGQNCFCNLGLGCREGRFS